MSRTEQLIEEISQLPEAEAQQVYRAPAERLAAQAKTQQLVARVKGIGAGVWGLDAQQHVTELRQHDRL